VVESHDAVMFCGIVGVPDKRKTEAPCLFVQRVEGQSLDEAELHAWLKPQIAHFKMPREVVFVEKMPLLGNGKVDRLTLRERALAAFA
jgi:fatty-acyl-CoA synthase